MATKRFPVTPNAWVQVSSGAALVDTNNNCEMVDVTTGAAAPAIDYDGVHTLKYGVKSNFSYAGSDNVYVKATSDSTYVIVTSDAIT